MSDRRFIDTNVVVYAYDSDAPEKQADARKLLRNGILNDDLVISAQVLGQVFNAVTRRIEQPMTADEASAAIDVLNPIPIIDLDLQLVQRAIETHKRYRIAYWDALIVVAAERAGCVEVLSEDLNAGQRYHDVVVTNPFATDEYLIG